MNYKKFAEGLYYTHFAMFTEELVHRLLSDEAPLLQPPENFLSYPDKVIRQGLSVQNYNFNVELELTKHGWVLTYTVCCGVDVFPK